MADSRAPSALEIGNFQRLYKPLLPDPCSASWGGLFLPSEEKSYHTSAATSLLHAEWHFRRQPVDPSPVCHKCALRSLFWLQQGENSCWGIGEKNQHVRSCSSPGFDTSGLEGMFLIIQNLHSCPRLPTLPRYLVTKPSLFPCWARSFNCQGLKIAGFEQFLYVGLMFLASLLACIKPQCLKWQHKSSSLLPPPPQVVLKGFKVRVSAQSLLLQSPPARLWGHLLRTNRSAALSSLYFGIFFSFLNQCLYKNLD